MVVAAGRRRLVPRWRMRWIAPRRWLWVRVLRWKLGVLELGSLIRSLVGRESRKLIEENVALRKLMFQSLKFTHCCSCCIRCKGLQGLNS